MKNTRPNITAMPFKKNINVSVIIVNYNGGFDLKRAVDSIFLLTAPFEVIIVDNNSTDESTFFLSENKYDFIKLIKNKENLGFSKANNIGASHASGEFMLFLNNDAFLIMSITPLIEMFESKPYRRSLVSCCMLGKSHENKSSFGFFPTTLKHYIWPSTIYSNCDKNLVIQNVEWVEGSFILTSRDFWKELGGFDEKIFMYGEDLLLCKKAIDIGGEVLVNNSISYIHKGGFNSSKKGNIYIGFDYFIKNTSCGLRKFFLRTCLKFIVFIKFFLSILTLDRASSKSYFKALKK
jgi:GT2 family glycosyltransferase